MTDGGIPRRHVLATAGAGIAAGTLAEAVTGEVDTSPVGIVETVQYRHGWVHIEVSDPDQTDVVRLIDPHGQQVGENSIDLAETTASFDLLAEDSYTGGRFTVEAFEQRDNSQERLGRGYFSADPSLSFVGFQSKNDGWPQLYLQNSGTGPARIGAIRCGEGFPSPGACSVPGNSLPIDPGVTLFLEFQNDELSPTTTGEESEIQDYAGSTRDGKIAVGTAAFDVIETTLELNWSDDIGQRGEGDDALYYCESVEGGEIP